MRVLARQHRSWKLYGNEVTLIEKGFLNEYYYDTDRQYVQFLVNNVFHKVEISISYVRIRDMYNKRHPYRSYISVNVSNIFLRTLDLADLLEYAEIYPTTSPIFDKFLRKWVADGYAKGVSTDHHIII